MKKIFLLSILVSICFISTSCFAQEQEIESVEILVEQGGSVNKQDRQEQVQVSENQQEEKQEEEKPQVEQISADQAKGMHLTIYAAASQFHKTRTNDLLDNTEMNAVVIDIKEIDGDISVKDVAGGVTYSKSVPSVLPYLKAVKEKGMYAIA